MTVYVKGRGRRRLRRRLRFALLLYGFATLFYLLGYANPFGTDFTRLFYVGVASAFAASSFVLLFEGLI